MNTIIITGRISWFFSYSLFYAHPHQHHSVKGLIVKRWLPEKNKSCSFTLVCRSWNYLAFVSLLFELIILQSDLSKGIRGNFTRILQPSPVTFVHMLPIVQVCHSCSIQRQTIDTTTPTPHHQFRFPTNWERRSMSVIRLVAHLQQSIPACVDSFWFPGYCIRSVVCLCFLDGSVTIRLFKKKYM